jgi:2-polyprenyl-3-methyl-5-hydroxy-6-metoxy-1,4-benzoquinol methylase
MTQPTVTRSSPRGVALPGSEPLTKATTIKDHMGLYQAPRLELVAQFLQQYGGKRPIPVAEILPVILMNYGAVEFHHAQTWFEAGEQAPGLHGRPSLIDVGAGFGPAGVVFGARHYMVTAIELQADIAAIGQRVVQACGLQETVHYAVTDVMTFVPTTPADTLIAVLCVLHVPDKGGVMHKLAAFLRPGGRAYLADLYAKGALSAREQALLRDEVACPGLLTEGAYIGALHGAGFTSVRFEDVTSEYATFVHQRWTTYRQQDASAQCDALTRFFKAMDTLFRGGDGGSSRLGGCRVYLER